MDRSDALAALALVALVGCQSELQRPTDVCAQHDDDEQGCWKAFDDQGNDCSFRREGSTCDGELTELGCFGAAFLDCEVDEDCPAAHECIEIEVPKCALTDCNDGEECAVCLACGSSPGGMCFAE